MVMKLQILQICRTSLDSALKEDKNYYPQVFLKECNYIEKEKKVNRYITDDRES